MRRAHQTIRLYKSSYSCPTSIHTNIYILCRERERERVGDNNKLEINGKNTKFPFKRNDEMKKKKKKKE
jgi:hypothetical protein